MLEVVSFTTYVHLIGPFKQAVKCWKDKKSFLTLEKLVLLQRIEQTACIHISVGQAFGSNCVNF